jgi:hypothetical protein
LKNKHHKKSTATDWSASVLACFERPLFGREQPFDYLKVKLKL